MSRQPEEISLAQAAAGMTLAAALLDAHGSVLLPRDATLTDTVLTSLRRRGVERCVVWGDSTPAAAAQQSMQRQRAVQRLAHLFRHSGTLEAGPALLALLTAYRSQERP